MRNLGIVIDSFAGFTQEEVNDMGFEFLPLQINVAGKNYLEGIETSKIEVLMQIRNGKECKTSLPPYAYMEEQVKSWSKKYEKVYVLPLNSHLSSEHDFLKKMVQNLELEDQIEVFDNNFNSYQYIWVGKHLLEMNKNGATDKEMMDFLEDYNDKSLNFLVLANIDALIRSGRLKKYQKLVLSKLKLIPIIKNRNGVTHDGVKRSMNSAIAKSIEKLIAFIGGEDEIPNYDFWMINTGDQEVVDNSTKELAKYGIKPAFNALGASSIMIHAGIDSISIGASKKI